MKLQKSLWYKRLHSSGGVVFVGIGIIVLVVVFKLFNQIVPNVHDINPWLWSRAYHELFTSGIWFPQWIPQLWYGFGLPVFYFYNPLFYWLTEIFQIIGLNTVAAVKTVLVGTTITGGIFMYLWAREFTNKISAWLAASLFILAPYYLSLIYGRGAFPEMLALSLIPLLLWLTTKLFRSPRKILYAIGITATLATIILTHSLTAVIVGVIYIVYVGYFYLAESSDSRTLKISVSAGILAIALTAFYWLPAILNLSLINTSVLTESKFFFGGNFPELRQLLNLPIQWYDGWLTLGLIPIVVLVLGWISQQEILNTKGQHRLLLFLALASIFIFLTLPYSDFLWTWLPGIGIFQFPSRFLGPSILFLAITAGLLLNLLIQNIKYQKIIAVAVIAMSIVLAWPFIQVHPYKLVPNLTDADLNIYKYYQKAIATETEEQPARIDRGSAAFEYIPRQLSVEYPQLLFDKTIYLFEDPDKIGVLYPPTKLMVESGDVQISTVKDDYYDMEFLLRTLEPSRIRINQFEFPSWKISLNDKPAEVEIIIDEPGQFLDIPTGNHTLKMKLVTLPNVFWSRVFSGIILLVSIVWLIWFKLKFRRLDKKQKQVKK